MSSSLIVALLFIVVALVLELRAKGKGVDRARKDWQFAKQLHNDALRFGYRRCFGVDPTDNQLATYKEEFLDWKANK